MNIYKDKGIMYSDYILNYVSMRCEADVEAKVETFYNCREQGYVLRVHSKDYKKHICIWMYANRWSDEPTISWDYKQVPTEEANMYNQETWEQRTESFRTVDEAGNKVVELIEEHFKGEE